MEHNAPQVGDKLATAVQTASPPVCRYLGDSRHVCANSAGSSLREGQTCHAEASQQLADLLAARNRADADLARQDAMAADADARLEACERWEDEVA